VVELYKIVWKYSEQPSIK